jgi:UDP-2,4-diacetamido-2,4,6-trideoxy-beta-L-altropyranose hydrolase
MNVIFRTDASIDIGTGHVMRCLTLAQALREQGANCRFICREHESNLLDLIRQRGFEAQALPMQVVLQEKLVQQSAIGENILAHAAWLGADWQTDAEQTKDAIGDVVVDWLIVDHYALDIRWEAALKSYYQKLMVIDDLADRPHGCDLLLDQNYYRDMVARYEKLVPPHCKKLLGPKYALLRPEFKEIRRNLKIRDGNVERLFIFFGGSDPTNETRKALHAIRLLGRKKLAIDVVVGKTNPHYEEINSLCAEMPEVIINHQVTNIAELMSNADLAIGAGGGTTWERCCVGLASLVWCIAENQLAIAKAADEIGVCINLGKAQNVSAQMASNALDDLLSNEEKRLHMKESSLSIVDGEGVARVLAEITIKLQISVVSDKASWLNEYIPCLLAEWEKVGHEVQWVHDVKEINMGDCVFFLGCGQIATGDVLARNTHNLVVHESALPRGKGWSPLTWQILDGESVISITLFEAALGVDSGDIYLTDTMLFDGTELVEELRNIQAEKTIFLCKKFISNYPEIISYAKPQKGESTYYPRRTMESSELEPDKTLGEQFNLLRVVDNDNYPAFIKMNGKKYILKIERVKEK